MSFFKTISDWWNRQWNYLGETTPIKKEKPVPVSPASATTGSGLVSTTATYYGTAKPKKKSVKKPPAKKKK